jgi:quercetin dioxygenase-like cupin family protein
VVPNGDRSSPRRRHEGASETSTTTAAAPNASATRRAMSRRRFESGQEPVDAGVSPRPTTFKGTAMKKNTAFALTLTWTLAGCTMLAQDGSVRPLLSKDLAGVAGKEVTMLTVDYPPGASTPAHTHGAQALVYVLEGTIVMQAKGSAPVTLTAGQTWYEGPDDVHVVSRNASTSAPAKYLVFQVKAKGAPILTPLQ